MDCCLAGWLAGWLADWLAGRLAVAPASEPNGVAPMHRLLVPLKKDLPSTVRLGN